MIITDYMTIEEIIEGLYEEYGEIFNWILIPFSESTGYFVNELKKELGEENSFLFRNVYAVAKCESNDDVLYLSSNDDGTKEIWRIYHLTYSADNSKGYSKYKEFLNRKAAAEYIQNQFVAEYL